MKLRKNQSGFSMIEVLSSMTVFAIAASGMVSTTMSTIQSNSASRQTAIASSLIQDKVERLRGMDPEANPADFTAGTHYDAANPLAGNGEGGGEYTRSWVVNANTPTLGVSEVIVTVSWVGANGERSLRASTFICNSSSCS